MEKYSNKYKRILSEENLCESFIIIKQYKMDQILPADDIEMAEPMLSTNFLQINEDCIIRILRFLPMDELNSVASTCMQLNAIARTVFQLKLTAKKILDLPQMLYKYPRNVIRIKAKRFLRNFGHLLNEVKLIEDFDADGESDTFIFENVVKYCSGSESQKFRMWLSDWTPQLGSRGVNLFENLKSLYANIYDDENATNFFVQLLPMCGKLEDLHLAQCLPKAKHFDQLNYSYLTELSLIANCSGRSSLAPSIERFLLRHKLTIKKFNLKNVKNFNLAIFEQMAALEKLKINLPHAKYFQIDNSDIKQLKLISLKIEFAGKTVSEFLNRLAPEVANSLRILEIQHQRDNLFIESLNKLNNLAELKIDGQDHIFQNLNSSIKTLTHLDVGLNTEQFDSAFTLALCQFQNLRTLKIRSYDNFADSQAFASLNNLKNITDFSCDGDANSTTNWLKNVGSQHTIKHINLNVSYSSENLEYFHALRHFSNLQILTIQTYEEYAPMLNAIDELSELVELRLNLTRAPECSCGCNYRCEWNGFVNLVRRLPKLSKLQLKGYREYLQFNLIIYSEFVDICRAHSAKLIIEFIEYDHRCFRIPADILEVYGDLCRYAEIQITPEVKEADF